MQANLGIGDTLLKKIENAFNKAVKFLHGKGSFTSKDLNNKNVKPLIDATYKVFKEAVNAGITTEVPQAMIDKLLNDVYIFSGMKTYSQLKEATLLLLDENNQVKPENKFIQDVQKINSTYNVTYLKTERQYALGSAQAAAKWKEFEKDGDRYNLQVRTAGDEKVRYSHALLQDLTLPINDKFWLTNWIPFDWGCRCNIVQVLKSKYAVDDTDIAQKLGEKAVPEIFRYNPGVQQVIFPPNHPYYKLSKEALNTVKKQVPDN